MVGFIQDLNHACYRVVGDKLLNGQLQHQQLTILHGHLHGNRYLV